ncbi:ornithine cyclodeaminase family protein [Pleomorphomonas oryzae]|uniref:ornithine cyclodeaminase family protein n=1 Tax=Pleomorphomonas oryzae TaxID=261934 RepID=UPI000415F221|nr:ornithine cyclodeaminase family protein [Pleomorphomonas oryzae]
MTIILKDEDLQGYACMGVAIDAVEKALVARARGEGVSPPRHHVAFPGRGDLVFTVGGVLGEQPLAGFRVYDTFEGAEHTQIVAVWSADDAELKGLILGRWLGAIRTGAIGGVAIRHMSSPDARVVGVVGSGQQARTQLAAAVAVRDITLARVFSRDEAHRAEFAEEMQRELGIEVRPAGSVQEAVADADIVLCATSSPEPVVSAADLKPGVHVNTLGPKDVDAHELALDVVEVARVIATDSREQTHAYAVPFFLEGSGHEQRMIELSDIVAGKAPGRKAAEDTTLFCSVGLAGTEVAVASAIFDNL